MPKPEDKPAIIVWLQLLALLAAVAIVGFVILKATMAAKIRPPIGASPVSPQKVPHQRPAQSPVR